MRRSLEPFKFKKFFVNHNNSTIAVGTDAVLLASWVNLEQKEKVLDVGTGCGLIALCLAQRISVDKKGFDVHALDIDWDSLREANENFSRSTWRDHFISFHSKFSEHKIKEYDLIISNPPFFRNSQKNKESYLEKARHQTDFDMIKFASFCKEGLSKNGTVVMVYPENDSVYIEEIFSKYDFSLTKKCLVFAKESKQPSRVLLEFSFSNESNRIEESNLIIYAENNSYTNHYINLTKEFYLNF